MNGFSFKDKNALVRVDFNVPLDKESFVVTDNKRIKAALPTIQHILENEGRVVLLIHLGRPKNGPEDKFSLKHIIGELEILLDRKVKFASDCIGDEAKNLAASLQNGEILLLENVRFYKEETNGDMDFAQRIAALGDCYVNDAFGTAHRAHATTTQIAHFFPNAKMFGFLMKAEIDNAQKVLLNAQKPFTAIVGGAKVSDKILIVENLLNIANHILIGGGMAYTFIKAMGGKIGNSLLEKERLETCLDILKRAEDLGVKIHLPSDSMVANAFDNNADCFIAPSNEIPEGYMALDIGTDAIREFSEIIKQSKTILWNGPMGVFEMSNFSGGTQKVAEVIAEATQNEGAFSLIGGGDSAAAIKKFNLEQSVSYVSTGGGALLEYFEGKALPGIEAITK